MLYGRLSAVYPDAFGQTRTSQFSDYNVSVHKKTEVMANSGGWQVHKKTPKGLFFVDGENGINYCTLAEPLNSALAPRVNSTTIR